jgi:hypothetical protein
LLTCDMKRGDRPRAALMYPNTGLQECCRCPSLRCRVPRAVDDSWQITVEPSHVGL